LHLFHFYPHVCSISTPSVLKALAARGTIALFDRKSLAPIESSLSSSSSFSSSASVRAPMVKLANMSSGHQRVAPVNEQDHGLIALRYGLDGIERQMEETTRKRDRCVVRRAGRALNGESRMG
jgi:hypothetical protein